MLYNALFMLYNVLFMLYNALFMLYNIALYNMAHLYINPTYKLAAYTYPKLIRPRMAIRVRDMDKLKQHFVLWLG